MVAIVGTAGAVPDVPALALLPGGQLASVSRRSPTQLLEVLVGTAESSELFLRALYEMVMRHGLADLFFLDKGPGARNATTGRR